VKRKWIIGAVGFAALALAVVAGCSKTGSQDTEGKDKSAAKDKAEGDHGHKPGQHGGTIVEIGRDNYHAEAVFAGGGLVRLYVLAKDEAQIQEVDQQKLAAYAKAEGDTQGVEFALEPKPRPDDAKGKTSVFEGTLPESLRDKKVEVTVTAIRIQGGRFRFAFRNFSNAQHGGNMPNAASNDKMKKLFATAKGKYTEADVKANGAGVTPADKYGDDMTNHDAKPKPGDRICPISKTKANPKITWIVGGKTYQFCCTPCINEFVKTAQEKPEKIKEPDEYVKK
jgi:YHS domain-containing protein